MQSGDRLAESGFTLVGLLVVVAIVNIALAVAMTSWVTLDRRAREAELIFRGEQIVRAIACYGSQNAGAPLERLGQLVEVGCLRREYGDPMSRDGEWRILTQQDLADGTIAQLLGLATPGEGDEASDNAGGDPAAGLGSQIGGLSLGQGGGRGQGGGMGQRSGVGRATGLGADRAGLGGAGMGRGAGGNVIIGVVSRSPDDSLRLYRGRARYGEWVFLADGTS